MMKNQGSRVRLLMTKNKIIPPQRDYSHEEGTLSPEKGSRDNPYTISEINRKVRHELECAYPRIWLIGEISNFTAHTSGHFYFSLKDESGQIQAAMFSQQNRRLRFRPEEGLEVLVCGRLSIYQQRGTFQIIAEMMEPKGIGSLQFAFEQLKRKLEAEGFFDEAKKKAIPSLPRTIGIVTSPTGAAIQDMLRLLMKIKVNILLCPSKVQGDEAADEIAEAIEKLNMIEGIDLIIVGRGGGSLEDLWPFNEETVARAIAGSKIPIISAVGHESDFTISDYVADLRTPTPSAAAALIVQRRLELEELLKKYIKEMIREGRIFIHEKAEKLMWLERSRGFIGIDGSINEKAQMVDELGRRMITSAAFHLASKDRVLHSLAERVSFTRILGTLKRTHSAVSTLSRELNVSIVNCMRAASDRFSQLAGLLDSLSPLAVLERGYSICRTLAKTKIIRSSSDVAIGENVDIKLHKGNLQCEVKGKDSEY